eukprot:2587765-Rhodomonas_salina.1
MKGAMLAYGGMSGTSARMTVNTLQPPPFFSHVVTRIPVNTLGCDVTRMGCDVTRMGCDVTRIGCDVTRIGCD